MDLFDKQQIEIEHWKNAEGESPASHSVENLINKFSDAGIFLEILRKYSHQLNMDGVFLELGAGQGWASCLLKSQYPNAKVIATDISPYAVESIKKWEYQFNTKIDRSYACKSYEVPIEHSSVDVVFCFAAAHHFLAHRKTFQEISRILKPGGKACYFYEPSSSRYLYKLAYWRVNRKRPAVPEDVLVVSKLEQISSQYGMRLAVEYYPSTSKRGFYESIYYYVLLKIPFLRRLLPCTVNIVLTKSSSSKTSIGA